MVRNKRSAKKIYQFLFELFIYGLVIFFFGVQAQAISSASFDQINLWRLDEAGRYRDAQQIALRLEHQLRTEKIVGLNLSATMGRGTGSRPVVVKLESGMIALVKGPDISFKRGPQFEEAAYLIDRILGLNFVPVTVTRTIDGKDYSFQLFIEQRDSFRSTLTIDRFRMLALDYLVQNQDRNIYNNLQAGGRVVAIDHSQSYYIQDRFAVNVPPALDQKSNRAIVSILSNAHLVNLEMLKAVLGHVLYNDEIEVLYKRIKYFQDPSIEPSTRTPYNELVADSKLFEIEKHTYTKSELDFNPTVNLNLLFYTNEIISRALEDHSREFVAGNILAQLQNLSGLNRHRSAVRFAHLFSRSSLETQEVLFLILLRMQDDGAWNEISSTYLTSFLAASPYSQYLIDSLLKSDKSHLPNSLLKTILGDYAATKFNTNAEGQHFLQNAKSRIIDNWVKNPEPSVQLFREMTFYPKQFSGEDFVRVIAAALTSENHRKYVISDIAFELKGSRQENQAHIMYALDVIKHDPRLSHAYSIFKTEVQNWLHSREITGTSIFDFDGRLLFPERWAKGSRRCELLLTPP